MKQRLFILIIILYIGSLIAAAQTSDNSAPINLRFSPAEIKVIARLAKLPAPPANPTNIYADNETAANFGQWLFFDRRLSINNQISCASCHNPELGWAELKPFSSGLQQLTRHTPSLWNAAYNQWFFWDGRADSLWSQALGPLENPLEMGNNRVRIAHLIATDRALKASYEKLFGTLPDLTDRQRFPADAGPHCADKTAITAWQQMKPEDQAIIDRILVNLGKALEAFERRIISRDSAFDQFAAGLLNNNASQQAALSIKAQRGLQIFITRAQCINCHSGGNFSDGQFHNIGLGKNGGFPDRGRQDGIDLVLKDPFNALSNFSDGPQSPIAEKLRFVAQRPNNLGAFKTPTLRNIATTAPYMHDGRFASLSDVIKYYSTLHEAIRSNQSGEQVLQPLNLSPGEIEELIAFLQSLTGKPLDEKLMRPPVAP